MKEFLKIFGIVVVIFVAVYLIIIPPMYYISKTTCLKSYENFSPSYGFWSEGRIIIDGKLTPVDIVRELK